MLTTSHREAGGMTNFEARTGTDGNSQVTIQEAKDADFFQLQRKLAVQVYTGQRP